MSPLTLCVGVAGLGRMGKRHALHFLNRTPRASLIAASTPSTEELEWAKQHLEPHGVALYEDYDSMLRHPGLQAIVVASVTTVHADQAIKALEADKHVLCEKPLSTSAEISESVISAALQRPHLTLLTGFSRRFDASYRRARAAVASGVIGTPAVLRSQTCDKHTPAAAEFFLKYAPLSGGIFVDCSIHDIDLCRWFFSDDASKKPPVVKSCSAIGITALHPSLNEYEDADNALGLVEFWDGKVAHFYASRTMASGQLDSTEIIGTKGKVTVNLNPARDLVEVHGEGGVSREVGETYYDRFKDAFLTEAEEFTAMCLDGGGLPAGMEMKGWVEAVRIGGALQESLRTGRKLWFDEEGSRIEKGML
ncbi:MAG: hypothetical protein Q9190_002822 [Brigantiaea leucoxantha]